MKQIASRKAALEAKAESLAKEGKTAEAEKAKSDAAKLKPGVHREDDDHALAWVRDYGKGRVFYTALGHRPEVWKDKRFLDHVRGGMQYAMGKATSDASPRPAPGE